MKRDITISLMAWKASPHRKPLVLMGARQVGKTHVLKQFGQQAYKNFLYLNFEDNPKLGVLFAGSLDPKHILKMLALEMQVNAVPAQTLIIFDEIQECPLALNSLKYFYESANEYHVCAAGSLLGVKLAHTHGFPVGKVNFLHLYPMSFMEFLDAIQRNDLRIFLEEIHLIEPLAENIYLKLLELFKTYVYIGGLPEAIQMYINTEDYQQVRTVQEEVLRAYALDFAKHAPPMQVMKISEVWQNIPAQLAKENKKFIFSTIRKGARSKEYESAINWLAEAGLINKVYNVSVPKLPLKAYVHSEHFKIYLVDVGLLGAMTLLSTKTLIDDHQLFQEFKGALTENYITQVLAAQAPELYYWSSEGKAELDHLVAYSDEIYPVEIKSGFSNKKQSLRVFDAKYNPRLLVRISQNNLILNGKILNCPLFLAQKLEQLISQIE